MSFSKKFVTSVIRDSVYAYPVSIVKLFEPLKEVKVHHLPYPKGEAQLSPYETYTAVNINPYTLEEQLMMYPVVAPLNNMPICAPLSAVVIHNPPRGHLVIDVE